MLRKVVCSAIMQDDIVYCGPRHHHILQHMMAIGVEKSVIRYQGFVDQHNVFMDRKEAMQVAHKANQIIEKHGSIVQLYSEDIY